MQTALQPHELASFYPMHDKSRFAELVEGMRQSGYRDEFPVVIYEGKILDGRNRYAAAIEAGVEPFIVQFSGDDPVEFVVQANSNRRDLEPGQRVAIHKKIRTKYPKGGERWLDSSARMNQEIPKKDSQKEFAKKIGVGLGTVARVDYVEKHSPELFEKIANGEIPADKAYKKAKEMQAFEQHTALVELAETVEPSDRWDIFQADIKTAKVNQTIDAVITDPPYPKEYLSLWSHLARFSKDHLKPGGVLLAMTPAPYLPEVMEMLGEYLTYQWIMACVLPGSHG
jgi:hypothetical protein